MSEKYPYWPDLTDDEGDALKLYFGATCGDCIEGRCHWGAAAYQAAAKASGERCGCARHADSVAARQFQAPGRRTHEVALAWRAAMQQEEQR